MSRLQTYNEGKDVDVILESSNVTMKCIIEYISYEMESFVDLTEYNRACEEWEISRKQHEDYGEIIDKMYELYCDIVENRGQLSAGTTQIDNVLNDKEMLNITKDRKLNRLNQLVDGIKCKLKQLEEEYDTLSNHKDKIGDFENDLSEKPTSPVLSPDQLLEQVTFDDSLFAGCNISCCEKMDRGVVIETANASVKDTLNKIKDILEWIESGNGYTDYRCNIEILSDSDVNYSGNAFSKRFNEIKKAVSQYMILTNNK